MAEIPDPLAGLRPPRPPICFALIGIAAFLAGSLAAYVAFTALWLLAEPTRNTLLAMLAFFVLFAGTGAASGLGLFLYHRLGRRRRERLLCAGLGEVFDRDRRSGDGD